MRKLFLLICAATLAHAVTLPEISLAGGRYPKAEVDISPGMPRLGSFFLKDYRVTFDFQRKRLWLER